MNRKVRTAVTLAGVLWIGALVIWGLITREWNDPVIGVWHNRLDQAYQLRIEKDGDCYFLESGAVRGSGDWKRGADLWWANAWDKPLFSGQRIEYCTDAEMKDDPDLQALRAKGEFTRGRTYWLTLGDYTFPMRLEPGKNQLSQPPRMLYQRPTSWVRWAVESAGAWLQGKPIPSRWPSKPAPLP